MLKSAGKAALAIAPLAVIALAPKADAQTIFTGPNIDSYNSGFMSVSHDFSTSGAATFNAQGATVGGITGVRFGTSGTFTSISGSGTLTTPDVEFFLPITNANISPTTLALSYDFTLSKVGVTGNVDWSLYLVIPGGSFLNWGNGSLTASSDTFTGANTYTVPNTVLGNNTLNAQFYLIFSYSSQPGDSLTVTMTPGSQGITMTAVPEPTTYALLFGLGSLGVVIVRRHQRAARAA